MTCRAVSSFTRILQQTCRIAALAVLVLGFGHAATAAAAPVNGAAPAKSCSFSDAELNPATNVRALDNYKDTVAHLLKDRNFAELECVANAARAGKSRLSGGAWTLHLFYQGLETPRPGHPTEEDWHEHMQLMQQWRDKYPQSMTARIGLAKAYIGYAWDARGNQEANTVSDSGWKLFAQHLEQAKAILEEAATTLGKDPEWFYEMQQISLGQEWDEAASADLFQKAFAFEPQYYYYLQMRARYLQPRWNGEPGDPERFAKSVADKVGGDDGDILYFQSEVGISCGCDDPDMKDFAWPRSNNGFAALEKKYGPSLVSANYAALMAVKANQLETADSMFKRIGDNWDEEVWITENWFKQNRDFADQMAPMLAEIRIFREDAAANLKSAGGQAYHDEVEAKLTQFEQPCATAQNIGSAKFQIFVEIGKDGIATKLYPEAEGPNAMAMCMMTGIYPSYTKKDALFPAPSKAPYAVVIDIDPATVKVASK